MLQRGGELYIPPEDLPLEQRNIDGIINRSYNTNFTFEHDNGELEVLYACYMFLTATVLTLCIFSTLQVLFLFFLERNKWSATG